MNIKNLFDRISLSSSWNEKCCGHKLWRRWKAHFVFSNVFRKPCSLRDSVGKHCREGQATDDNMAHAHCLLVPKVTKTHSEYVILSCCTTNKNCNFFSFIFTCKNFVSHGMNLWPLDMKITLYWNFNFCSCLI